MKFKHLLFFLILICSIFLYFFFNQDHQAHTNKIVKLNTPITTETIAQNSKEKQIVKNKKGPKLEIDSKANSEIMKKPEPKKISRSELKQYLINKTIKVESIRKLTESRGIYVVNEFNSDYFYIDENKNIIAGMIINLDTSKNISLSKENKEVLISIKNGRLLPFDMENFPSSIPKSPPMKTKEDFDKLIINLQMNIQRLKQQKEKL